MRVGIVEDQVLYQRYLTDLISRELGYDIVLCIGDGDIALTACIEQKVELLILDLKIHNVYGIELAEKLLKKNPLLKILTYSGEINAYNLRMIESLGILGYLDKSDPMMQSDAYLVNAIKSVVMGKRVYTPGVAALSHKLSSDESAFHKVLSPKKIEILKCIGRCMTDSEIAEAIGLSSHTVRKHRTEMVQNLNLDSTHSLIRYAQKNGFSNP